MNSVMSKNEIVKTYDVINDCKQGKNVKNLKDGIGIFIFNETQNLSSDFDCHYELENIGTYPGNNREVGKGYKFHVFINEMYIFEKNNLCNDDYVQFGRDKGIITTFSSEKYCGVYNNQTNLDSRTYLESKDSEMDLWIHVSRKRRSIEGMLIKAHSLDRKYIH